MFIEFGGILVAESVMGCKRNLASILSRWSEQGLPHLRFYGEKLIIGHPFQNEFQTDVL